MFHIPNLTELLVIGVVLVLLFGASRLPETGRALGEGIRNFKKGLSGDTQEPKKVKGEEVKDDNKA